MGVRLLGNAPFYEDYCGLYTQRLRDWLPDSLFDAHVHLGPKDATGEITIERTRQPVTTFLNLEIGELMNLYARLYEGKQILGLIAFPFPLREVNWRAANAYIVQAAQSHPQMVPFLLAYPDNVKELERHYRDAERLHVHVRGVKPYYDLVGKPGPRPNFITRTEEFVSDSLLDFTNQENLILMLHTGLEGIHELDNQNFLRRTLDRYPKIKIILAHMGRYLHAGQFDKFFSTEIWRHPNLYFETSSATEPSVYKLVFSETDLHPRILFGSDVPFGLITGREYSPPVGEHTFVTRTRYPWTDDAVWQAFGDVREQMTYNTYHTIAAVKDGITSLRLSQAQEKVLKRALFSANALALIEPRTA